MGQTVMTPKQRAIEAFMLRQPDQVPMFELEFQLEKEMYGKNFFPEDLRRENIGKLSAVEKERRLYELASDLAYIYNDLDYAIIPIHYMAGWYEDGIHCAERLTILKHLRDMVGDVRMFGDHADGTFSIPDGNRMYEFAYEIADDPEGVHARAKKMMEDAIETNKRRAALGIEVGFMCCDYCYNSGPFLSPVMFSEFVTPYLAKIVEEAKKEGLYVIKHTDGDIMPILDQLVACEPHAIHSLDPMAGVDIKVVKEMYGDRVALCGNVNCSFLQTGTEADLVASAEYCMEHGKKNGGYIYCTSNVPFKGTDPKRYQLVLDVWKRTRNY